MMDTDFSETLIKLLAAWLLLAGASAWAARVQLGLSRRMLVASLRGLLQLMALAFVLHWIFDITSHAAQALLIAAFCLIAGHNSASHYDGSRQAWLATAVGLACGCLVTLPWLAFSGAVADETRALVPLGSMLAANGMNSVSIMFERLKGGGVVGDGLRTAMTPAVDTLRMVGMVHMPGIFVGMVLAGASAFDAAAAQLVVLYMLIASTFTACMVTLLLLNHWKKAEA